MYLTIMTTADRLGADHFFRFKENFGLSVNLGAVNLIFNVMKSSNAFFSNGTFVLLIKTSQELIGFAFENW